MTDNTPSRPLAGLRVVEIASFVAGPSCGTTLSQLGAEVIRIDPLGGAPDIGRWPVDELSGASLFWNGLNRAKRSVAVDFRSEAGRDLVLALATAPGAGGGLVVDNQVGRPWLSFDALTTRRADVIQVHLQGHPDGRAAVDYTVNPEVGLPSMTGPPELAGPVNHVLPAWDLIAGALAVGALLAALRRRDLTGEGGRVDIALSDVALAAIANMGWLAEADQRGRSRERVGNYLYGSYGVDFVTSDDQRVMVVALTGRQWRNLITTTGIADAVAGIERSLGIDLGREGDRYQHRELVTALLRPWFNTRTAADIEHQLIDGGVLCSRYRTLADLTGALRQGTAPDILGVVTQPGIGPLVSARSPIRTSHGYGGLDAAPRLGEHTDAVLREVLGADHAEIARLRAAGTIGPVA